MTEGFERVTMLFNLGLFSCQWPCHWPLSTLMIWGSWRPAAAVFGKVVPGSCVISLDVSKTCPSQNWPSASRGLLKLCGGKCFFPVFPD